MRECWAESRLAETTATQRLIIILCHPYAVLRRSQRLPIEQQQVVKKLVGAVQSALARVNRDGATVVAGVNAQVRCEREVVNAEEVLGGHIQNGSSMGSCGDPAGGKGNQNEGTEPTTRRSATHGSGTSRRNARAHGKVRWPPHAPVHRRDASVRACGHGVPDSKTGIAVVVALRGVLATTFHDAETS